jgi:hypothetical protein
MRIYGLRRAFSKFWVFEFGLISLKMKFCRLPIMPSVAAVPPNGGVRDVIEEPCRLWLGLRLPGRAILCKSGNRSAPTKSFAMTGTDRRAGAESSMQITEID